MKHFLIRGGTVLLGAWLLAAAPASAQQAAPDVRAVPELRAEFERAERMGLPLGPLVAQARKGYLVREETGAIKKAVRNLTDRMDRARSVLAPVQSEAELEAGAEALRLNVPASVLKSMRASARTRSLVVPIGVLTELVSRGVPVQRASDNVGAFLERQVANATLISLSAGVTSDVATGLAPTLAFDIRSQSVLSLLAVPGQSSALAADKK